MNMIKKRIIDFLNKKSDFPQDIKLKNLNDQYFFLLSEVKVLLNYVVRENIKYFFKHKKLYLLKLFLILALYLGGIGAVIFGGLHIFNLTISKKPENKEALYVFRPYLPDTDTIAQLYAKSKGYDYVIIFLPDPKKDWKAFKRGIHKIESKTTNDSLSYHAKSGQYWGRYQLGDKARELVGLKNVTWKEFSTNPEMQEGAFLTWARLTKKQMLQYNLYKYVGTYVRGVQITESGLIALVHNVGIGGALIFLKSNGQTLPPGNPLAFIKVGGYNVNLD